MKEVGVMVGLSNLLVEALEEKSRVDERAKRIALEILRKWVEEQLVLCTSDDGAITRESAQKAEAMSTELSTSLSTALGMSSAGIASQANTILRRTASSRGLRLSNLVRFDPYANSLQGTIKLQYKH